MKPIDVGANLFQRPDPKQEFKPKHKDVPPPAVVPATPEGRRKLWDSYPLCQKCCSSGWVEGNHIAEYYSNMGYKQAFTCRCPRGMMIREALRRPE